MKKIQYFKTAPGLALLALLIVSGGASVYALSNWFGADVPVNQSDTILHIDLSACKTTLPPGVNPNVNKHDVRYKITGTPHLSADALQKALLGSCEASAIKEFYARRLPEAGFDNTNSLSPGDPRFQYALIAAKVVSVGDGTITLTYSLGAKGTYDQTKTFVLAGDATVFDKSMPVKLTQLTTGDQVEFVAYAAGLTLADEQNVVTNQPNVKILSLFKTQYDVRADQRMFDAQNNLQPLY